MDARRVREYVAADDWHVAAHDLARERRHHLADRDEPGLVHLRAERREIPQARDDLGQVRVAGTLSEPVDTGVNAARARSNRCKAVRGR